MDLFWQEHGKNWAVEVKYADAPRLTPSMTSALRDLDLSHLLVVYPGDRAYPLAPNANDTAHRPHWRNVDVCISQ